MSNLLGRSCPTSSSNGGNNDDVDNLSPYELLRQERMRINAAKMLELGLVSRLERPSTAPKRAKLLAGQSVAKRRRGPAAPPLRSSPRLASTPAAPLSQPSAFPFSSSLRPPGHCERARHGKGCVYTCCFTGAQGMGRSHGRLVHIGPGAMGAVTTKTANCTISPTF